MTNRGDDDQDGVDEALAAQQRAAADPTHDGLIDDLHEEIAQIGRSIARLAVLIERLLGSWRD